VSKPKRTPAEVIQQLRDFRAQIEDDLDPMTPDQRRDLRDRTKHSRETVISAVSAIGMSDNVKGAIGMSSADVQELIILTDRWADVELALKALLNGVSSANLKRRYQLAAIADHAFAVTKQLVRWPENSHLIPIYEEMQRLRKLERQKKRHRKTEEPAAE